MKITLTQDDGSTIEFAQVVEAVVETPVVEAETEVVPEVAE